MLSPKLYIYIFVNIALILKGTLVWSEGEAPPLPKPFSQIEVKKLVGEKTDVAIPPSMEFKPDKPIEWVLYFSQKMLAKRLDLYWGEELALQDCLERAMQVNAPLLISLDQLKLAKTRLKETRRSLFPSAQIEAEGVEGTTIGEDFRGRGVKFKMQQPLWNGLKNWKLYKQARLNMEVAKQNYNKLLLDLKTETTQSYYLCVEKKASYDEWLKLKTDSENILASIEKRFEKKIVREVELLSAQKKLREIEIQLLSAQSEWNLAQLSLRQLLRYYDNEALNLKADSQFPFFEKKMAQYLENAFEQRSDYLLSQLNVRVSQYEREIAYSDNNLKIDLDGSVGYRSEAFDSEDLDYQDEFFVGLRASLPFWGHKLESNTIVQDTVPSAGQTTSTDFKSQTVSLDLFSNTGKSTKLEADIKLKQSQEELEKNKRTILFEVSETYFNTEKAYQQLLNYIESKKLQEKEIEFVKIQVGLNEAELSQLLETQFQGTEAQVRYHNSLFNYRSSLATLSRATGETND